MNELRIKDYIKFDPEIHSKRQQPYTVKEIELILTKMPLADLSVVLERPAKAIAEARKKFKRKYPDGVVR